MKKVIKIIILLCIFLYGCGQLKEKEPLAGEAYEILEELAVDLSDYPDLFSGTVYIVVGQKAPSIDVISGIDIALELKKTKSALDNEINITNKNAIIIGNPCDNKYTNKYLPYEKKCNEYVKKDKAVIKLVKTGSKTYAIVVFGYSPLDTRRAAQVLKNYKTSGLKGVEMIV